VIWIAGGQGKGCVERDLLALVDLLELLLSLSDRPVRPLAEKQLVLAAALLLHAS
jgi:hypothetical protein